MRRVLAAGVILGAICPPAPAWGPEGHRIVAEIATHYLLPETVAAIRDILGADRSLGEVSSWADEIRAQRRESAPWHYVNIPAASEGYVEERDCPTGECVVGAVRRFARELGDPATSPEQRREALMFLVHFVADLHQPLHCYGEARGGNDIRLRCPDCPGDKRNLHAIWDTAFLQRQPVAPEAYAGQLIAEIDDSDITFWIRTRPEDWATESWRLALTHAVLSPRGRKLRSGDRIGRMYLDANTVIVDGQLARAGVRLADLLNVALRTYEAPTSRPCSQPATATAAE